MDPNETLKQLREWARKTLQNEDCEPDRHVEAAALLLDLDEWLVRGGFLPRGWSGARRDGA